ncbi:hypothetical protein Tco_0086211 [Tanacetum coccineum]
MQGGRLWRCLCAAAEMKPQGGDVANLATKKWIQGACKLLRNEGGASLRCLDCMVAFKNGRKQRKCVAGNEKVNGM